MLVIRIMNTWSLHMLHRDVYIRPCLLMPKQLVIQRVSKIYMGITIPNYFALSVNTPFIFEMQLINGAIFLNATALFVLALSGAVT